jgi:Protein-glutamine gamma-glutamyltransferase
LCQRLQLDTQESPDDLDREIMLAMLASPIHFEFPSFDELLSALRVRRNIVQNARRTALAFDTEHAERPEDFWTYDVARGFTLKPGKSLIEALQKTTQPDRSGKLFSFSCYRATEYVILLSIAQELACCNPDLLVQLQQQWETRAIMSGQFHDVFLHEYGSMEEPLPPKYYVPGDRVWFRNPDEYSSNVEGYEGSWVFYLGDGLFTNFWKRDQPFTISTKCLELFHWRNSTYRNADGKLQIDDDVVDECVAKSLQDPLEVARIVNQMLRLRDPGGVYLDGGCIDTTRECARRLRPGTGQLSFPG